MLINRAGFIKHNANWLARTGNPYFIRGRDSSQIKNYSRIQQKIIRQNRLIKHYCNGYAIGSIDCAHGLRTYCLRANGLINFYYEFIANGLGNFYYEFIANGLGNF